MVRWYHAIFTAYGFWLPNDPRGSWSTFVGSWELRKFGPATKTNDPRSLARVSHDRQRRVEAKQALKYPSVRFNKLQQECIATGIQRVCDESKIVLYACAIGHDHVHAVVASHTKPIEQIVARFKGRSTQEMGELNCHPMQNLATSSVLPSPWSVGCWRVFINDETQLQSAIRYVQRHPLKESLPRQTWSFVHPPQTLINPPPRPV